MKQSEILEMYGKLTKAQEMAEEFYENCDDAKYIEYSYTTASVYVEYIDNKILRIINKIKQKYPKNIGTTFFPKDILIEIWFD